MSGTAQPTASPDGQAQRWNPLAIVLGLLFVSGVGHWIVYEGATAYARGLREDRARQKPVELVMFEVERPKPPPPEEPEPPPKIEPKVKPPPVKVAAKDPVPPPENLPPPPNDAPPPEPAAKPVPIITGISMSSTSSAGSFAAPVGNTMYGKMSDKAADPSQVQGYRPPPGRYVPSYQVDRQPEVVGRFKVPYPPEAKRAGVEGEVWLSVRIDAEGNVTAARVVDGPGYGMNEAALEAIRRSKWTPAINKGEPVATEIKYRFRFLLD